MIKSAPQSKQGFALLFTLVIVSVVLAIGLTILDFTIKQITLSAVTRDSEAAFHGANAGFECIRSAYINNVDFNGTLGCVGVSPDSFSSASYGSGSLILYSYSYEWQPVSTVPPQCIEIELFAVDATGGVVDIEALIPSEYSYFPTVSDCPAGQICHILASRGLNRACDSGGSGTVQREVFGRF